MKIDATIQARMASTRLPGKVLMPIVGKPMLALQIERIQQCKLLDRIIISTSRNPQDDAIEELATELDVECFRGSEEDVLSRVVNTLKTYSVEIHVEFQGDNPIPDPLLVDSIVGYYLKNYGKYDYVTNALKTTYPPGTEVYVYHSKILYDAARYLIEPNLREHVGIHIHRHPDRYRIFNLEAPPWFYYPDLHLEVDTQEDLEVITAIYEHFYPTNPGFNLAQVIDFINSNPDLANHNRNIERRWKRFHQE